MGCHTWVYKKITALDEEYKKERVRKEIKDLKDSWILTAGKEEFMARMKRVFPKYTEKEYTKDFAKYVINISKLSSEGFSYLVELKKDSAQVVHYKGEWYWHIDFDVPFRVYGYPEQHFRNKSRLKGWLKRNEAKLRVGYYDDTKYGLIEGYTKELVKRIDDYYKLHGEDNLYFEFG